MNIEIKSESFFRAAVTALKDLCVPYE
jgi:hypothetical protein